ncbi:flagellar protein (plasmid) [Alloyangia pacifica]|uniref:Flagellin n=1 Tax=Alloyangia pacifica TaxID=311180 RepID=A0A2U8HKP0_9RHOB|nr:flagellin [Alloyangia pacifica]AWI86130.1 flagellar protein [Alloyangia pacifica]
MSSINTNASAMNALSTLRGINKNLEETQSRISTGLKVQSGKDNASYFQISTTMSAESGMNTAINEGLTLAKNSISTAALGAEEIVKLAKDYMDRAAFAQEEGVDQAAVGTELTALTEQMKTIIAQSVFNGENLLDAGGAKVITTGVTRNATGGLETTNQTFTFEAFSDIVTELENQTTAITASTAGQPEFEAALGLAQAEVDKAIAGATTLGVSEKAIETQQSFLNNLTDRLDSGVGAMVDADMEEEAARLQALQVQQQLATQSLSIANSAPQNILSLFR